jgi:hypothetical protein
VHKIKRTYRNEHGYNTCISSKGMDVSFFF